MSITKAKVESERAVRRLESKWFASWRAFPYSAKASRSNEGERRANPSIASPSADVTLLRAGDRPFHAVKCIETVSHENC